MSQLPNYMGIYMLIVTLFVLSFIYQSVGASWKTRPWIPLLAGVLILLAAYAATLAIDDQTKQTKAAAENAAKHGKLQERETFMMFTEANERQTKLLELVTIPLAVSLIASSLFARADRAFQAKVVEFEERKAELEQRERDVTDEEAGLVDDLTSGLRGQSVIDRRNAISEKRSAITFEHWKLLDDYGDLLSARLVRRVERKKRRPPMRS